MRTNGLDPFDNVSVEIADCIAEYFMKFSYLLRTSCVLDVQINSETIFRIDYYLEHAEIHLEIPRVMILPELLVV